MTLRRRSQAVRTGIRDSAHFVAVQPLPSWIPAFAGMTNGGPERRVQARWNAVTLDAARHHFRTNRSSQLAPTQQGMETRSCGFVRRFRSAILPCPSPTPAGDKPPRYISHPLPSWIPAFAGMTNGGRVDKCVNGDMRALSGSPRIIFVPMAKWGPERR